MRTNTKLQKAVLAELEWDPSYMEIGRASCRERV